MQIFKISFLVLCNFLILVITIDTVLGANDPYCEVTSLGNVGHETVHPRSDGEPACGVAVHNRKTYVEVTFPGCTRFYKEEANKNWEGTRNYRFNGLEDGGGGDPDRNVWFTATVECYYPWVAFNNSTVYSKNGFSTKKIYPTSYDFSSKGISSKTALLADSLALQNSSVNFTQNSKDPIRKDKNYSPIEPNLGILSAYFDTLYNKALASASFSAINQNALNIPANSTLSTLFATNSDSLIKVNGNLTVGQNFICDKKSIFLVTGTLSIFPNFTNSNVASACMFMVKGSVTVGHVSGNIENLDAMIVTPSTVTFNNGSSPSPLVLNGSIVSSKTIVNRLAKSYNKEKPNILFNYDPRFKIFFQELFIERNYSIRESL